MFLWLWLTCSNENPSIVVDPHVSCVQRTFQCTCSVSSRWNWVKASKQTPRRLRAEKGVALVFSALCLVIARLENAHFRPLQQLIVVIPAARVTDARQENMPIGSHGEYSEVPSRLLLPGSSQERCPTREAPFNRPRLAADT